jgi:O-antigen ligase
MYLKMFKIKISFRHILWLVLIFEAITAYLVGVGAWPQTAAWFSLAAVGIFILLAEPFEALLLTVVSIPFYLAIPNPYFDSLSAWRLAFAWLFIVWFVKTLARQQGIKNVPAFARELAGKFFVWDKYLLLFIFVSAASILLARFPGQSARQILFLINASLLYVVLVNVINTKEKLVTLIKATAVSLGIIVLLGYVQFAATLFANQYYFWQYWALLISKAYYGLGLANVLVYSNSWFSYTGGQPTLRMFSIMPDSHSFGVVCIFLLAFLTAFLSAQQSRVRTVLLWIGIGLTCWALILSGTRGIWVSILAPIVIAIFLYWKNLARRQSKKFLMVCLLLVLVFAGSPFIAQGLNWVRSGLGGGNYLDRVGSIYDLEEQSNAGRLIIWKDSLKYSLHHPLGVGYGNFIVSLVPGISATDNFENLAAKKNLRYNLPQKFVTAHSLYLNILVELGIAGIIVFAWLCLAYAARAWKFLKQYGADKTFLPGMAVAGSFVLLWLLAYGVFDLTLFNDKVLSYSFILLAISGLIFRHYGALNKSKDQ